MSFFPRNKTKFPSVDVIQWRILYQNTENRIVPFGDIQQTHKHISILGYIVWRFGVVDAKATTQINCIIRIWAVAMNESEKRTVSDWLDSV